MSPSLSSSMGMHHYPISLNAAFPFASTLIVVSRRTISLLWMKANIAHASITAAETSLRFCFWHEDECMGLLSQLVPLGSSLHSLQCSKHSDTSRFFGHLAKPSSTSTFSFVPNSYPLIHTLSLTIHPSSSLVVLSPHPLPFPLPTGNKECKLLIVVFIFIFQYQQF